MSERDVDDLIREISKMAERVGAVFVPDKRKIDSFRGLARAVKDSYRIEPTKRRS